MYRTSRKNEESKALALDGDWRGACRCESSMFDSTLLHEEVRRCQEVQVGRWGGEHRQAAQASRLPAGELGRVWPLLVRPRQRVCLWCNSCGTARLDVSRGGLASYSLLQYSTRAPAGTAQHLISPHFTHPLLDSQRHVDLASAAASALSNDRTARPSVADKASARRQQHHLPPSFSPPLHYPHHITTMVSTPRHTALSRH